MLFVVKMDGQENTIVGRFEAWSSTCEEDANKCVSDNNLKFVYEEVNLNGDWIWFCE